MSPVWSAAWATCGPARWTGWTWAACTAGPQWSSRYICGLGEVLRAAWGESHLGLVLTRVRELRLYVAVLGWWAVLLAVLVLPMSWTLRMLAFAGIADPQKFYRTVEELGGTIAIRQSYGDHHHMSDDEIEDILMRIIPEQYLFHAHHWLILHGRYTCKARRPECEQCVIADLCKSAEKTAEMPAELRELPAQVF